MSGLAGQAIGLDEQSPTPIGGPAAIDAESKGSMENFIGFGAGATSYDPAPVDFDAADDTVTSAADGTTRVAPEYTDNQLTWGGAGPVFNPIDLFASGEQGAWYDPSDLTTLFQDSAGTIPVTVDGQPVGLILDKSGNNNHAFQSTDAKRPLYKTSGGLHWIQFDGIDDELKTAAIDFSSTSKIFAAFGVYKNSTSNDMIVELGNFVDLQGSFGMYNNVVDPQIGVRAGSGFAINTFSSPTYTSGQEYVYGAQFDIAEPLAINQAKLYMNGSEYQLDATSGSPSGTGVFGASHTMIMGAHPTGDNRFSGRIYQGIVCGKLVSVSDNDATSEFVNVTVGGAAFAPDSACASLGDSIAVPILPLTGTARTQHTLAVVGDTTAQQTTVYRNSFDYKGDLAWTMILTGQNDYSTKTTSEMIAGIQTLVNDAKRYSATSTKVLICKLTPSRQALIDNYGAVLGEQYYQTWLLVNEAIAGGGATPITGADARVTSHEATLNDGNGNLKAMYDDGSHLHPNDAGDQVIADAVVVALQSLGVTP